jgi:hypothetical protein
MLPTEKTTKQDSLDRQVILVYGPPKIGKSTFCSQAPEPLFLATEPGLNHLETFQVPCQTWEGLCEALADIAKGEHKFKTIVIDTIDNAYQLCSDAVCRKQGITHPADMEYGKGHGLVNQEFRRVLTKAGLLPYGLILVSHTQTRDRTEKGITRTVTTCTLPESARKVVMGYADIILYCDVEDTDDGERRVLRTKPTTIYEAGDRTGRLPAVLDLDWTAFEAAYKGGK